MKKKRIRKKKRKNNKITFVVMDKKTGKELHICDTMNDVEQYLENYK